jgi:hypothetical protein
VFKHTRYINFSPDGGWNQEKHEAKQVKVLVAVTASDKLEYRDPVVFSPSFI